MTSPTHVTTFYSFKGGVGRSLLLANVGWQLAERRQVLLWDLDVEAPGLHRIPALRPPEVKRGFFEWLGHWTGEENLRKKNALTKRDTTALQRLVLPVPGRPNLAILPAFGDTADFARLYAEGPWRRLLVDEPSLGLALFDAVLAVLGASRDHLLIDSRTGITDVGGFLAALLPHATVLVGGYGHQSLHGTLHVHKALEPAVRGQLAPRHRLGPGAELRLVHVVSPVPEDVEGSAERRRIWREVFGVVPWLEIPFDRRLLWDERLLAADDPTGKTGQAYTTVAARLTSLREELLARSEAASTAEARYPEAALADSDPRLGARRGLLLEVRVQRLLELHGYTVERKQLRDGHEEDLVARIAGGLDEQCWWVECKDHQRPVGKDVLEKLAAWIDGQERSRQRALGMVVARSFTPAAVSFAADRPDLRAWTIDDLERRLFDPRPYLQGLVSAFEQGPLGRTYVEQNVLLEGRPEESARAALLPHALAWVGGDGTRLWLLLGDYGTGKSAFFQHFACVLARRALADPEAPFPLAIDLKEYPNATSAEILLFEHLRRRLPAFRGDPAALLHLLSTGRCVLLLDSFDEMGAAATGRSIEQQFRELARLAGEEPLDLRCGNRVLVTCRTHFFRDQQRVKDTASRRLVDLSVAQDSALGHLARRFNAAIDEICPFEDEQITAFLEKHLGPEAIEARKFIRNTYDLPQLATRPGLLELIVQSLPALWREGRERVTSAGLYEVYTHQWLDDRSGRNLQTPPVLRHRLVILLASTLWRREDRQLHYRDLLAEVRQWSGQFQGLDHDRVDIELRTASFLVRSADGYYRFSHKSFLEYFLARGLWDALAREGGPTEALDLPALNPEVCEFFWQLPEDGRDDRLETLRTVLQSPYRPRVSENALRLGAWSRRQGGEAFQATRAQLVSAQLAGEDLSALGLADADLSDARLDDCLADGIDLTRALLENCSLAGADLTSACLREACLDDAVLRGAVLDRADFSRASLLRVDLTAAEGDATIFEQADLSRAQLAASVWTEACFRGVHLTQADTVDWLLAAERDLPPGATPGRLLDQEVRVEFRLGHRSWARAVSWSPDGRLLASASSDGSVRIWAAATGEAVRVLQGTGGRVLSASWSPDGCLLACASSDGSVRIWEATSGGAGRALASAGSSVWSVSWSPDGRLLASASSDGSVRIWEAESGKAGRVLASTGSSVWSVSWSPDGRLLAAGSEDGLVRIWDASSAEVGRILAGSEGSVSSISWSPDGRLLASAGENGSVRIWDAASGEAVRVLAGAGGSVWSVSWSPDGRLLASGSLDGSVRIWEAASGEAFRVLQGAGGRILSVCWSPDGRLLASASLDGSVRIWKATSGEVGRVLAGAGGSVWSVCWSPNGRLLASGSLDGSVRIWKAASGKAGRVLAGTGGSIWSISWSPDGRLLASGSLDGSVRIWEAASGEESCALVGTGGSVLSVSWSPNGRLLASGSEDGSVRIWEVATRGVGRVLAVAGSRVLSVSWSPDGRLLASGSEDGLVRIWEVATGEVDRGLVGAAGRVLSVSWSPNGRLLASGNEDGTVRIWEVATGQAGLVLAGTGGSVLSVSWSSQGGLLASGSLDGSVHLWDSATGEFCATFSSFGEINFAAVPGGWFVQSPSSLPLDPRRYRLLVTPRGEGPDRGWRVLPLGGLGRWLHSPERVRAALRGEHQPPPVFPGAAEPGT